MAKIGTDYVMTHKGRQEEGTSEGIKLLGFITGASGRLDFKKAYSVLNQKEGGDTVVWKNLKKC